MLYYWCKLELYEWMQDFTKYSSANIPWMHNRYLERIGLCTEPGRNDPYRRNVH